jgi:murein L,D-transpeptidase YcbB/YkuD
MSTSTQTINPVASVVSTGGGSSSGGSYWAYTPTPMIAGASSSAQLNGSTNTTLPSTTPLPTKYVFIRTLSVGSTGDDVIALQQILKHFGYFTFQSATGYFGPITRDAVISFQRANKLAPYPGIVGPKTRELLNNLQATTVAIPTTEVSTSTDSKVYTPTKTYKKQTIKTLPKEASSTSTTSVTPQKKATWTKILKFIETVFGNLEQIIPSTK